jgi:octopine/nopaline transport system substrate-binding protein
MNLLKLTAIAGAALALGLASGDASAQNRKVKIATEGAYAPYNFVNAQGKLDGFEIELGAELCKRAKFDCEFVAQDWDGIMPSLLAKKYDVIMAGMNITPKRMETIQFTSPYVAGAHGFLVLKSSSLAKMPGGDYNLTKDPAAAEKAVEGLKPFFKGKVIGVQVSTTNSAWTEKYFKGAAEIREYKTTEQHDLDLAAGRVDAVVQAHASAQATIDSAVGKDMMIAGPAFRGGMLGLGVALGLRKEDNDLKAAFDAAVKSAIADGTIKTLSLKWFKIDMTPQS